MIRRERFPGALLFAAVVTIAAVPGALLWGSRHPTDLGGTVHVVDGDTVDVGAVRVRLFGMDAPESDQTCTDEQGAEYDCGAMATAHMHLLVDGFSVQCERRDIDQYGRVVAICYVGDLDLGGAMVRAGLALDWPYYSHGRYASEQATARRMHLGIWAGTFISPAEWRQSHPWHR